MHVHITSSGAVDQLTSGIVLTAESMSVFRLLGSWDVLECCDFRPLLGAVSVVVMAPLTLGPGACSYHYIWSW